MYINGGSGQFRHIRGFRVSGAGRLKAFIRESRGPRNGDMGRLLVPMIDNLETADEKLLRKPIEIKSPVSSVAWDEIIDVMSKVSDNERASAWRQLAWQFQRPGGQLSLAALAHVLADLHLQGWRMQVDGRRIWVIPPIAS